MALAPGIPFPQTLTFAGKAVDYPYGALFRRLTLTGSVREGYKRTGLIARVIII